MIQHNEVAVLFVARGINAGMVAARQFVEAWRQYPPAHPCRLYFLVKGWHVSSERRQLDDLAKQCSATVLDVSDDGFDWGAYFQALPSVHSNWICLMNSHARPLVTGWLSMLMQVAETQGSGIAGATGSWESLCWKCLSDTATWYALRGWLSSIRHYKKLRHFASFPNPHLRSTGLVIKKTLFEQFAKHHPMPKTKVDALALESGLDGLSRFAQKQDCRLMVVGRNGMSYASSDWPISGVFRSSGQENLLIADNRTHDYLVADVHQKNYLKQLAWGDCGCL